MSIKIGGLDDMPDELRAALRKALGGGGSEEKPSSTLPEAHVMRLRELYDLYQMPNPYKPGDFVTPRQGTHLRWAGRPSIVLEVRDPFTVFTTGETGPGFGRRLDMRVAVVTDGNEEIAPYWSESWLYERWVNQAVDSPLSTSGPDLDRALEGAVAGALSGWTQF